MNTQGTKTVVVIVIWAVYEILANVVPGFQRVDQVTIAGVVEALSSLAMPVVMLILRLRTTEPVNPVIANAPLLNRMVKK